MTNALDLCLPPNALRIIVQGQASGRLPTVRDHPAGRPARTAKSAAAAKRTTTRSRSRKTMPKPVSASTHVRGVPAHKPTTQPPEVIPHRPPPANVRARRAMLLARPKPARPPPLSPTVSRTRCLPMLPWGDCKQSAPQLAYQPTNAAQAAPPRAKVTLPPAYAEPSAAAGISTASRENSEIAHFDRFSDRPHSERDISTPWVRQSPG